MGEDSCADSAGPHPEAGCELAGSSHADSCAYCSSCYLLYVPTVLMGEDSCADSAGPHPEAGCELAGHLKVTDILTALLVIYFMFLPFSWVKTAVQTVQGHILRLEASWLVISGWQLRCFLRLPSFT